MHIPIYATTPALHSAMQEFPGFDFSEVEYDEDMFYEDERESDPHCWDRVPAYAALLL